MMKPLLIIAAFAALTACELPPHRLTTDRDATGASEPISGRVNAPGNNEGEGFNP